MFLVEVEGQMFGLKPMNCPESTIVYRHALRSYRDLPLRFSDMGRLHRNERSGTLTGLFRVRQFTQDDAHVYCRLDQLQGHLRADQPADIAVLQAGMRLLGAGQALRRQETEGAAPVIAFGDSSISDDYVAALLKRGHAQLPAEPALSHPLILTKVHRDAT